MSIPLCGPFELRGESLSRRKWLAGGRAARPANFQILPCGSQGKVSRFEYENLARSAEANLADGQ
jgi:hypothetical protein